MTTAILTSIETERSTVFKSRPTPYRIVGDQVVLARPSDGSAVALNATAAVVWSLLDDWHDEAEIDLVLGVRYPSTASDDRRRALSEILNSLLEEGLLDRSQP